MNSLNSVSGNTRTFTENDQIDIFDYAGKAWMPVAGPRATLTADDGGGATEVEADELTVEAFGAGGETTGCVLNLGGEEGAGAELVGAALVDEAVA